MFPVCFNFKKFILPFKKFKPENNNKVIHLLLILVKLSMMFLELVPAFFMMISMLIVYKHNVSGILSNHFRKQLIIKKHYF